MTVLLAAPILLTLTLLLSGLAKLGARQGTEDAMTSLRLPWRSMHRSVASVLPVTEIVLALGLWFPFVPLQVLVAVVIALLLVTYLVIIARALRFEEQVECSCFGTLASPTVSGTTLGRNLMLVGLGVLTVIAAASGLLTAALVQAPLTVMGLGAALLLAVVLTALTLGGAVPETAPAEASPSDRARSGTAAPAPATIVEAEVGSAPESGPGDGNEELLDYERTAIPAAVVQRVDGRLSTLRQLASHRAALLVFVSEGCGPCERVLDQGPGWLEALSPVLDVHFVFATPLDHRRERTVQRIGDHALHDLQSVARGALGARSAPSAVLLGADGLLAGGPVTGGSEVIGFVEEILEQLQEAQQPGERPAAESPSPAS
ncbi:MauE/DoxX family redox-associated membrane protein [Brachybacterium saurashtrense]|uniref:Methylamine utilisation protein MauE domain-containing protein n=1 Tax=Brachybacterium saurashtrense TaxID=556288 RepID=A0A345YSG9_9MICO|nr:MauE/DoxX family redox-associated membrane protein [Brachybacterium saurashtrense]AXK46871.1 hypothetical protein DWV08_15445 [Brachybacterium saurashtrense]RRR22586.1 hypothetical protein DXU92_10065 [Brachybacterium saurashtrense]